MSGYSNFSFVYDRIMADFDYPAAAEYLVKAVKKHKGTLNKPLDFACGSGRLATELIKLGLDPVCVDGSPEILNIAKERLSSDTLILCQDMSELDLNDTVDVCFCTMDSINYITDKRQLQQAFNKLSLFTDKEGLFIFDVNTEIKFINKLGDATYSYDLDDLYLVWNTSYDKKAKKTDFDLTWFSNENGNWKRYDEYQQQRFWTDSELKDMLNKAGFIFENVYDAYTFNPQKPDSERLHYIFRKA